MADSRELGLGTMVRVQAMQRAIITDVEYTGPYLTATVAPLPDLEPAEETLTEMLRLLPELQGLVAVRFASALLFSTLSKHK